MNKTIQWVGWLILALLFLGMAPRPVEANNLIQNSDFASGDQAPWQLIVTSPANATANITNGEFCTSIFGVGANRWDLIVRHPFIELELGHSYQISFEAFATLPTQIYAKVGLETSPFTEYWNNEGQSFDITTTRTIYSDTFTMNDFDIENIELAFHFGRGQQETANPPFTICLDDIELVDLNPTTNIRVNQVGYLPQTTKRAVLISDSAESVPWTLINQDGSTAMSGNTIVYGDDVASGDSVHHIDFTSYQSTGEGFRLQVNAETSHPFDIGTTVYADLSRDTIEFFYNNRSGIPLVEPYVDGPLWEDDGGHIPDEVTCFNGTDTEGTTYDGCDYTLDVTGGWYDAGDHGKYVVGGATSAWILMNAYERADYLGDGVGRFADESLALPEAGNGVSDLLDEVRWQMEMLLAMQVPDGQPLAGMVHHKVHDENWAGLPLRPSEANSTRYAYPPSTAATLNLAATGAQCGRVFASIDTDFASTCVMAAEKAWNAAILNPDVFTGTNFTGGGAYNDDNVSDEFYWAAVELFITTANFSYHNYLTNSAEHNTIPTTIEEDLLTPFNWRETTALAAMSLATVDAVHVNPLVSDARDLLMPLADTFVAEINEQGYRVPFDVNNVGGYPWGSNSAIIHNLLVLGLVYDFTNNPAYLHAMSDGFDYILGRNPVDQSFVTGFGTNPVRNLHHRFWANQVDETYPPAPPGVLSGGPNSGLEDPLAQVALAGCAPMRCHIDHIDSWSTNEMTIYWNASLAWVANFLDEHADNIPTAVTLTTGSTATEAVDRDWGLLPYFAIALLALVLIVVFTW